MNIEELKIIENNEETIQIFEEDNTQTIGGITEVVGGTTNYERLSNKPQINEVELIGNKTSEQLNLQSKMDYLTNMEIENLIK